MADSDEGIRIFFVEGIGVQFHFFFNEVSLIVVKGKRKNKYWKCIFVFG